LLLRARIVVEDLKYSKTSILPQIFKIIITSRKTILVFIMMRQYLGIRISPLAQVVTLIVLSLLTLVYLVGVMPFEDWKLNASEILNNSFLYIIAFS